MASSEDYADELDTCPECGRSAMSSETPCSRCQPPTPETPDDDGGGEDEYRESQCQNCGSHVSESFRRVLGDNENVAHACSNCSPRNSEYPGRVAGVDTDGIQVIQR